MRDFEDLRYRILAALGLVVAGPGCGATPVPSNGTVVADAATADGATDAAVVDGAVDAGVPDSAEAVDTIDGAGPKLCEKLPSTLKCFTIPELQAMASNPNKGGFDAGPPADTDGGAAKYSGPLPPQGCPDPKLIANCCETMASGTVHGDTCCYWRCADCICGRPFVVHGQPRVAPLVEGAAWSTAAGEVPALLPTDAAALAAAWRADGLDEHASVASFLRFGLDLLACGAPPDLVAAASLAAADEVAHAQLCFSVAARLDGRHVGPGPLDCGGVAARTDLAAAVAAAVHEGCVGETVAAAMAATAARLAVDAATVRALEKIADDEARHAELAWRFVAWAVEFDVRAYDAAAVAFAEALSAGPPRNPRAASLAGVTADVQASWGRVPEDRWHQVARAVLTDVVATCAARLLPGLAPVRSAGQVAISPAVEADARGSQGAVA